MQTGGGSEAALSLSEPEADRQAKLRWNDKGLGEGFVIATTGLRACPSSRPLTVIRPAEGFLDRCQKCNGPRKEPVSLTYLSL